MATKNNGATEPVAKPLSRNWKAVLTGLLIVNVVAAVYYSILVKGHLEETSALFIGLPMALGLLVIHLTRAKSLYGDVLRANVIFLAIVAPLLGEGSLCLLMSSPLFIGFSMAIAAAMKGSPSVKKSLVIAFIPLVMGMWEKSGNDRLPKFETVTTRMEATGGHENWVRAVQRQAKPAGTTDRFLRIGFPLPLAYSIQGDRAKVSFSVAESVHGEWQAAVIKEKDGVDFRLLSDSTKIGRWMDLKNSRVRVLKQGAGLVIEQETRFRPRLRPLWYFLPAQRHAVAEAHQIAFDTWQAALGKK